MDDNNLFHLVSDSQRLSFSQELTATLTLRLSLGLGLGLAWGDFQNKYFLVYTSFKDFSLNFYDYTNLFHLVSDFQRLSFFAGVNPNPNPNPTPYPNPHPNPYPNPNSNTNLNPNLEP